MKQFDIKDTILGKKVLNPEKYNQTLLFRIPRSENREVYGINGENLPFVGYDIWSCYELSFLTNNGLPVNRVLKMIYSANSQYLVESKSLKLYLWSFRNEGVFHEHLTNMILDDLAAALKPRWCKVTAEFAVIGEVRVAFISVFGGP